MAKIQIGTIPETDFAQYDTYLDFPHLYNSINDDFTTTGLTLSDAISVHVTKSYNTFDTLAMTYPRDGIHHLEIQKDRYILEDSDYRFTHQIFKITHVTEELDDIAVEAEHIASTLNDATVPGAIQMANATAQDVMNQVINTMQPQKAFIFHSNVTKVSNVNIEKGQQAGSILIDPDQEGDNPVNSIPGLYGGELQFDNFDIYHDEHLGHDTNIIITYGKNIKEFSHDVNTQNMWTGAVFTASYTPGQAVATETNVEWSNWSSDYSNVGTYAAGGSVDIYDSPVEGHQVIGQLSNGETITLGAAVHNGDMSPDGKYQINTVNGDDWYPVAGGGWVDARWISFDSAGTYMVNDVSGDVTVQADNPYEDSGAGSRVSMGGSAVVAYKPGGSIHVYYSPEIGSDHYRKRDASGKYITYKNGSVVHYDMVERNQNGDVWYRIGPNAWLYGPHLSTTEEGSYRSYTNHGYGYIKPGQQIYHWSKKTHKMTGTTRTTVVAKSKSKRSKNHWKSKKKKVKVTAKKGRTTIDRTIVQGGVTYMHTSHGWVKSGAINYSKNGSVKPKSWSQIINQQVKDHSKVEIYATPDSKDALNWSIPNGASSAKGDFKVLGHEAKGGDGKTYVEVSYAGKTGWLMEDNINSDQSTLNSADDDEDEDSDSDDNGSASVDQQDVVVTVGPLYADGFGVDPNVDKVNSVDLSSNFQHDDQDLSGQQSDGTFVATQADIDQLTKLGQQYLIEHKYGHPEVQDTISYEEMSGINADWTQLGVYDYVTVYFPQYDLQEKEQVNTTVWDALNHHYIQISIGKIPESWQHLLLQKANEQTMGAVRGAVGRTQGWLNRFEDMMNSEGSDRRAKENAMMEDLGMLKHDVTYIDKNGKTQTLKDVFLESRQEFEDHFQKLDDDAGDIKSWIDQPGNGIIQALPNWQAPQQFKATASNNANMTFDANGLEFFDRQSGKLLGGLDSRGHLYADSIEGVKVNAMEIDALEMHGHLVSEDPNGSMKVYIGTQNPGSTLNPWKGGRVIWATSDQYSSMFSSGQVAVTNGSSVTRIHPTAITVGDDDNQVLTQENFAAHAYRRIRSWVKGWVADYITINGTRHTIWKDVDGYKGKLRDLPGQGRNNYDYVPGSNDDYGNEDIGDNSGIDLGDNWVDNNALNDALQNITISNPDLTVTVPNIPTVQPTSPINPGISVGSGVASSNRSKMLTYTQAKGLGLPSYSYLGTTKLGNDGNLYRYMVYTPTGNDHWFRT